MSNLNQIDVIPHEQEKDILKCLDSIFKSQFYKLGVTIGRHPWHFIIIPIIICLLMGTGLINFNYSNDPEYLFVPNNGPAQSERNLVETVFPMNYTDRFNPSRFTRPGRIAKIYVTAQDGGNLLRLSIWQEIRELDQLIRNSTIFIDGQELNYDSLCARWQEQCYSTDLLDLVDIMAEVEVGNQSLSYPVMFNPSNFNLHLFPLHFGGIDVSNESTIESVKALRMAYFVRYQTPEDDLRGVLWEQSIENRLNEADAYWTHIQVDHLTWWAMGEAIDQNAFAAIPYIAITMPFVFLFAVGSMMSSDWVKSKPWLGAIGMSCTLFGSLAAFGLVSFTGTPLISICLVSPLLMLGIGIDDAFVMVAAWRQTSIRDPVAERMGATFSEAAVSITITSLTDFLSFFMGLFTPFQCVRIFCLYTGVAVVGTYLCQVFIFGGAMALFGSYESRNRHGLFLWRQSIPKSKLNSTYSFFERYFLSGGTNPCDPQNPLDDSEPTLMVFFRDYWAPWVNKISSKVLIILSFLLYLTIAFYGISQTQQGLDFGRMSRYDSREHQFFNIEDTFFRSYPYRIQVVLTGDLEYSNPTVQSRIETFMKKLENSKCIDKSSIYVESWLRSFLSYAQRLASVDLALDLDTEEAFIKSLKENYLGPSSIFFDDVKFDENKTKIIASRFVIQAVNVLDSNEDIEMVSSLRTLVQEQLPDLNVTIFNPYFIYFDQYTVIRSTTAQCVGITCLIMIVVSIIFIPNLMSSVLIGFSILSIEAGVIGCMMLWNVYLDPIAMMASITCIGFSVDFCAHISYAFISASVDSTEERLKKCLYSLGVPIVQAALSTVLGVITLMFAPSYMLNTLFKAMLFVMVFATAHALFLLPVLLSLFGPGCRGSADKMERINKGRSAKLSKAVEVDGNQAQGMDNQLFMPDLNSPKI